MTLEDFFTLTEMKDGLMIPARVEELIYIMHKERDSVVKNVADTTRQWSAVASTIAATESKDCLDHFIQLDGLWFIDRWLKNALKFGDDASDNCVEESIMAMLHALEKLHLNNQKSISSGIRITVKNLLGHKSSKILDMARVLFDSWKQGGVGDAAHQDVEKLGAFLDDETNVRVKLAGEIGKPKRSTTDCPVSNEISNGVLESVTVKRLSSKISSGLQPEKFRDTHKDQLSSSIVIGRVRTEDRSSDSKLSSAVSTSVLEIPIKEAPPFCKSEGIGSGDICSLVPREGSATQLDKLAEDAKQAEKLSSSSYELSRLDFASTLLESQVVPSRVDSANTQEHVTESLLRYNIDDGKGGICQKTIILGDTRTLVSEKKSRFNDMDASNSSEARKSRTAGKFGDCYTTVLQESSKRHTISGKYEDTDASFSRMEDIGACLEDKKQDSDESYHFPNTPEFSRMASPDISRPAMNISSLNLADSGTSDNELDYGIVDALEVARQVAQEVEREVIGCRQRSGSSSSEKIVGGIKKRHSQDSFKEEANQSIKGLPHAAQAVEEVIDYRQRSGCTSSEKIIGRIRECRSPRSVTETSDQSIKSLTRDMSNGKNLSTEACEEGEVQLTAEDNLEQEQENCTHDMDSSQLREAAHEQEANTRNGKCDFDLNEVCSDNMEHQVNPISTPISVVSASRLAAAPGFPAPPLQFEGTLGWKGSAATGAFRPASPCRISDSNKTVSVGGTYNSSKPTQGCLANFDLNVVIDEEYKLADPVSIKIPASSDIPSGESSVEVISSQKSERLKLDLNLIDDDTDTSVLDSQMEGRVFFPPNVYRSPSPASSCSSIQPSLRNIDLNGPFMYNEFTDQGPYNKSYSQNLSPFGIPKPDESVISIMGTKVRVDRKDLAPPTISLPNGNTLKSGTDANMGRNGYFLGMGTITPHIHSPMSFSSAVHGPGGLIPYMVDSRGAPVVPQIVGSASALSPSPQPFIMSTPGASSSLHAMAGISPPKFELNSGFVIEGGNRESAVFRQHFVPGQGSSGEEHLRANPLPSSCSVVSGKRKEPDLGFESYPFTYKHHQPPWK